MFFDNVILKKFFIYLETKPDNILIGRPSKGTDNEEGEPLKLVS
jgi:hypothetical protein